MLRRRVLMPVVMLCALNACATAGRQSIAPARGGHAWLVFVDDLHLDFRNTGRLRNLVQLVARELIQEGDIFAVRSSGPSLLSLDWTSDRSRLVSAAKQVTGNGLKPSDIISDQARAGWNELRYRARTALAVASELVSIGSGVTKKRKALLYISNGSDLGDETFGAQLSTLARRALGTDVRIFAIDPRTLPDAVTGDPRLGAEGWQKHLAATQDTLRRLSEETGGVAVLDADDAAGVVKTIAAFRR